MELCFAKGYLPSNHHGPNSETVRGWKCHIVKLETFLILANRKESLQSLIGRRLWIYASSGACWNFDVYLLPKIKPCAVAEAKEG